MLRSECGLECVGRIGGWGGGVEVGGGGEVGEEWEGHCGGKYFIWSYNNKWNG